MPETSTAVRTVRRIAIVNMKGGVGKTTTAIHVAAGMALGGLRVLLVDADPQGNVGHALGVHGDLTIRDLMLGTAAAGDVITRGVRERLDVITSSPAAFSLETQLAGAAQRETILARRLQGLTDYDAIVIDSSPAMSLLTYNALLCANEVVLPVGTDSMALIGAKQTMAGIQEIRELWPDRRLDVLAVLPTAVNPATNAARAAFDALEADPELQAHLYRPGIRQCIDITYAVAQRQTIWEYAPRSRGAADYSAFVQFIASGHQPSSERATASQHTKEGADGVEETTPVV